MLRVVGFLEASRPNSLFENVVDIIVRRFTLDSSRSDPPHPPPYHRTALLVASGPNL